MSKKKSIEHITKAKELGIKNFGENYAQELENKAINFDKDVNWHFIGPLQSNKAKIIAKHADWIHTIDRKKIAEKINDECKNLYSVDNKHLTGTSEGGSLVVNDTTPMPPPKKAQRTEPLKIRGTQNSNHRLLHPKGVLSPPI